MNEIKMIKVKFETLPKENIFIYLYRRFLNKPRFNEYIRLNWNGNAKIIKRGVIVELPKPYLEIANFALKFHKDLKYDYEIV